MRDNLFRWKNLSGRGRTMILFFLRYREEIRLFMQIDGTFRCEVIYFDDCAKFPTGSRKNQSKLRGKFQRIAVFLTGDCSCWLPPKIPASRVD